MMTGFAALLARDLRLVLRRPGDVAVVLAFFVVATTLFPLVPFIQVATGMPTGWVAPSAAER